MIGTVSQGQIREATETISGSGSIAFAPIVKYSTIDYTRQLRRQKNIDLFLTQSELEEHLYRQRKQSAPRGQRSFRLRFHNHTSLKSQQFRAEVKVQMQSLIQDFIVDSVTYAYVLGTLPKRTEDLQIIVLQEIGGRYSPSGISWDGWDTYNGRLNDVNHIDIHVVEDLPAEIGHGYARFSWLESSDQADIVILQKSFGSGSKEGFDQGKVLTHLMGNYFGLYPLTGQSYCDDDGIDDTPIHNAPLNFCDPRSTLQSSCDNQPVMSNNFMTHTPDACKDSFTVGQWKRMLGIAQFIKRQSK